MSGRLIVVVGASGAGKDTLIAAARERMPNLVVVRRVITRPAAAGHESFEGVSEQEFERRRLAGEFALDWRAHGLRYGIPATEVAQRDAGCDVLFNGSRAALDRAARVFPDLLVIRVVAPSTALTDRLLARGRESREEIAARLARAVEDVPAGLHPVDVLNDGPVESGVARFLAALAPPRSLTPASQTGPA